MMKDTRLSHPPRPSQQPAPSAQYMRDHPKTTGSQMTVELHGQPIDSGAMIK